MWTSPCATSWTCPGPCASYNFPTNNKGEKHHGQQARRTQAADTANPGGHAGTAPGREDHHGRPGRPPRMLRGRPLPSLRQQGPDVRGPHRIHRDQPAGPHQPDHGGRGNGPEAGGTDPAPAAGLCPAQPGHDPGPHRRCPGARKRAPAGPHQPVAGEAGGGPAAVPQGGGHPGGPEPRHRLRRPGQPAAVPRQRPLAAIRQERLQPGAPAQWPQQWPMLYGACLSQAT